MRSHTRSSRGFTLVELLVSITIFATVMALATSAFTSILRGYQQRNIERHVFEEARFIMEKIVKEIRNGGVDYSYYYLNTVDAVDDTDLNYFDYYSLPPHTYINDSHQLSPEQDVLAVVSPDGTERTLFWASGYDFDTGELGSHLGDSLEQISTPYEDPGSSGYSRMSVLFKKMLYWSPNAPRNNELAPYDPVLLLPHADPEDSDLQLPVVPEADPEENWTWYNDPVFESTSPFEDEIDRVRDAWRPISSSDVQITDLSFIIRPLQDPYKFWDVFGGDSDSAIRSFQSQPSVTIILSVEPDPRMMNFFSDKRRPRITLQRTISARSYEQIYYNAWPRID